MKTNNTIYPEFNSQVHNFYFFNLEDFSKYNPTKKSKLKCSQIKTIKFKMYIN